MSCSQTAQASASNATARRGGRIQGARRIDAPIHRVVAERAQERAEVVVDAEAEPQPGEPGLRGLAGRRPGAHDDAVQRRLRRAQDDGLAADVQQPLQHAAASAGDAVHAPAGQAVRRCGAHLGADLDLARHRTADPTPAPGVSACRRDVDVDEEGPAGQDAADVAAPARACASAGAGGCGRPRWSRRLRRSSSRRRPPPASRPARARAATRWSSAPPAREGRRPRVRRRRRRSPRAPYRGRRRAPTLKARRLRRAAAARTRGSASRPGHRAPAWPC